MLESHMHFLKETKEILMNGRNKPPREIQTLTRRQEKHWRPQSKAEHMQTHLNNKLNRNLRNEDLKNKSLGEPQVPKVLALPPAILHTRFSFSVSLPPISCFPFIKKILYIYIYICVCVCVCIENWLKARHCAVYGQVHE